MSGLELPFNALGEQEIEREALAIVFGLDGLAVSQAIAALDRAKELILLTHRVGMTEELRAFAGRAGMSPPGADDFKGDRDARRRVHEAQVAALAAALVDFQRSLRRDQP